MNRRFCVPVAIVAIPLIAALTRPDVHARPQQPTAPKTFALKAARLFDGKSNSLTTPGVVVVADGTEDTGRRLERVLTTDPGMGIIRHADAGYPEALEVPRTQGVKLPMDAESDRG